MSAANLALKCPGSRLLCLAVLFALTIALGQQVQAQYAESVPYTFTGSSDGAAPAASLILDSKGNLYGTATNGGDTSGTNCPGQNPPTGCGVVFELSPPAGGSGSWTENVLYTFTGASDGSTPEAGVILYNGNLYGTAAYGGDLSGSNCVALNGCGVVFELSPPSGGSGPWTEKVLYTFTGGNDGSVPLASLIFDAKGNLYGTTGGGGASGYGVVFELTPPSGGNGSWTESVIYPFTGGSDGGSPEAALIFDSSGNLYGTASIGGGHCNGIGCGVVFELTPNSPVWTETVLYTFTGGSDGASPEAGLIFDSNGNLYSTATLGGYMTGPVCKPTKGCGVLFELTPPSGGGAPWTETVLYAFTDENDGAYPQSTLVLEGGNLYGTALLGGNINGANCSATFGCGVVFEFSPPTGKGSWSEDELYTFNGSTDGAFPYVGVIFDSQGNIYGTTYNGGDVSGSNCSAVSGCGVVFELSPQTGAAIELSPSSLNFGNQVVGTTSSAKKVTVKSVGTATLDISSISASASFNISKNTCGTQLPVGNSCVVDVTFTPAQLGQITGALSFFDNAPNSPQSVALSGTGIAQVSLTPSSADYGDQKVGTTSKAKKFSLTNSQSVALTNISISTTGDFAVSATTCGTTLAAHSKCTISVTFTPTQSGTCNGELIVDDNASNSPQTATLTGTGD